MTVKTTKKTSKPVIGKGYSQVEKNDKKFGTYKDCKRCRYDLFGECSSTQASAHDYVVEFGRTYCCFFVER